MGNFLPWVTMGRSRRSTDPMQIPAELPHGNGKRSGFWSFDFLKDDVLDPLQNKRIHTIADVLTMIMVTCLLCTDPTTATERYGLPDTKKGLMGWAVIFVALRARPIGLVFGTKIKTTNSLAIDADNALRVVSLFLLALVGVHLGSVAICAALQATSCWLKVLLTVASGVAWCISRPYKDPADPKPDPMQTTTERPRGRHETGNTGGLSFDEKASQSRKLIPPIVDLFTIIIASILLGLHCMCLLPDEEMPERFGLPDSSKGLLLTAGTLGVVFKFLGVVFKFLDPEISTHLHAARTYLLTIPLSNSLLNMVPMGNVWPTVLESAPDFSSFQTVLTEFTRVQTGIDFENTQTVKQFMTAMLLVVASGFIWYVNSQWIPRPQSDPRRAAPAVNHSNQTGSAVFGTGIPNSLQILAAVIIGLMPLGTFSYMACCSPVVVAVLLWYVMHQYNQQTEGTAPGVDISTGRSRSPSCEHEALGSKKKSNKKAQRGKRADILKLVSVAKPPAADRAVEYDSGYSSSGDDEHSLATKLASVTMQDERTKCEFDDSDGLEDSTVRLATIKQVVPDCCVCLEDSSATCAIMPCRHLCLCSTCVSIGLVLCPICREKITDIVPVGDVDGDVYF